MNRISLKQLLRNTAVCNNRKNLQKPGCETAAGFGLHELMVVLSLVAVLSALAVPSYGEAIEKRRITNGAEQIVSFVRTIQTESVKRNRMATVSYSSEDDGSWCIGAVLNQIPCDCMQTDQSDPGFCAIDSAPWVLRDTDVQARNLISSVSGDGAFAFDPVRGMFRDPTDSLVLGLHSGEGQFRLNLSVASTGKIALCLPSLGTKISGFSVCAGTT
jgi:prepilin-type N-terminal cleavage/methylation domain-containing protein